MSWKSLLDPYLVWSEEELDWFWSRLMQRGEYLRKASDTFSLPSGWSTDPKLLLRLFRLELGIALMLRLIWFVNLAFKEATDCFWPLTLDSSASPKLFFGGVLFSLISIHFICLETRPLSFVGVRDCIFGLWWCFGRRGDWGGMQETTSKSVEWLLDSISGSLSFDSRHSLLLGGEEPDGEIELLRRLRLFSLLETITLDGELDRLRETRVMSCSSFIWRVGKRGWGRLISLGLSHGCSNASLTVKRHLK